MHEIERKHEQIQQERLTILAEKSKLETMERLKRPMLDNDNRNKAEIDAAIQVAKVRFVCCTCNNK